MPLQPRHEYAADFPGGLPANDANRPRSSPHRTSCECALLPSPDLPDSSWWIILRSVRPLVSHVHLPVLLAGPGPSDSAGPSRRCRGCLPPMSVRLDGVGCPQLRATRCDKPRAVSFHHRTVQSASWRSASHIQILFFSQEISGNGSFGGRGRNRSPSSLTRCLSATRNSVEGETNTVAV